MRITILAAKIQLCFLIYANSFFFFMQKKCFSLHYCRFEYFLLTLSAGYSHKQNKYTMKKLFILFLSTLSLTAVAQQKKVAVYVTGDEVGVNKVLGSKLVSAIARSNEFSAIERTESFLAELSKEQNYQRTGAVDDSELSRLGKQFGVQYICVAAVSDAFDEKYLSARLIDVETAQVERTASSSGAIQSLEGIINAANSISNDLLTSLGKERQSNLKKVAVYVVKNEAGRNIGRVLGDKLVAGFTNSGRYIAIERTNSFLAQLNKEQDYQHSGAVDDSDLSRLGKQFGVQYVCVADVSDVFGEKYISARLIDVETAEVVNTHDTGGAMNSMSNCLQMANDIAANLSKGTFAEQAEEARLAKIKAEEEVKKRKEELLKQGYVDLGLSSGTLWRSYDEYDFYTEDQAINQFGNKLPTKEQFKELQDACMWNWQNGVGYKVTGPNGESITLQIKGYKDCSGTLKEAKLCGYYWTKSRLGREYLVFKFNYNEAYNAVHELCNMYPVRLVTR